MTTSDGRNSRLSSQSKRDDAIESFQCESLEKMTSIFPPTCHKDQDVLRGISDWYRHMTMPVRMPSINSPIVMIRTDAIRAARERERESLVHLSFSHDGRERHRYVRPHLSLLLLEFSLTRDPCDVEMYRSRSFLLLVLLLLLLTCRLSGHEASISNQRFSNHHRILLHRSEKQNKKEIIGVFLRLTNK